MSTFVVNYTGSEKQIVASVIHEWMRGEIPEMVMSGSSGPKDMLKNRIFLAFEGHPEIERIRWMVGQYKQSTPFMLFLVSGAWFDCTSKQVSLKEIAA